MMVLAMEAAADYLDLEMEKMQADMEAETFLVWTKKNPAEKAAAM